MRTRVVLNPNAGSADDCAALCAAVAALEDAEVRTTEEPGDFSLGDGSVARTIHLARPLDDLAAGAGAIWGINAASGRAFEIDPARGAIRATSVVEPAGVKGTTMRIVFSG